MNIIKLSILIPTIEGRETYLSRILGILGNQSHPEVEVIVEKDNRIMSIGEKRNKLLEAAKGNYIAFVDDDDVVSSDYVSKILDAIQTNPDCVGIHLLHYEDHNLVGFTYHSLNYSTWFENTDTTARFKRYYRNPNHLNPVKRMIALKHKFPLISMGEDKAYSMSILKDLKTEVYIREPIYYYLFRTNK